MLSVKVSFLLLYHQGNRPLVNTLIYCTYNWPILLNTVNWSTNSKIFKNYSVITGKVFKIFKKKHVPLASLMCPLQITNDIDSLLLTLPAINEHFIHQHSNTHTAIIQTVFKIFKNKKSILNNDFLHRQQRKSIIWPQFILQWFIALQNLQNGSPFRKNWIVYTRSGYLCQELHN